MPAIRRTIRLLLLIFMLITGIALTLLLLPTVHKGIPIRFTQKVRQRWFNLVMRIIGIRARPQGTPVDQPALWVSNHISWADIPVIGGLAPVSFLSKAEIRDWPIIGWLASQTGTLFIERGNRQSSSQAMSKIQHHIEGQHSILVFPEGTTTKGHQVQRFYPRLFAPAINGQLPVQPVALSYEKKNGERHDKIAFIDQEPFFSNLWSILGEKQIVANVTFLPMILAEEFAERRELAENAHQLITQAIPKLPE